MNKTELISKVSEATNLPKNTNEFIINKLFDVIMDTVASGEPVKISGFGIFDQVSKLERQGVNPKTGEKITIAAKKTPKFKPSKNFKEITNK